MQVGPLRGRRVFGWLEGRLNYGGIIAAELNSVSNSIQERAARVTLPMEMVTVRDVLQCSRSVVADGYGYGMEIAPGGGSE